MNVHEHEFLLLENEHHLVVYSKFVNKPSWVGKLQPVEPSLFEKSKLELLPVHTASSIQV